jgi:CubicO group peptidase (beta-lactamase class C family)
MGASGWMLTEIDPQRHAKLYEWNGQEQVPVEWYGLATWPDGGLRTSVRDLARFYATMIGGGQFQEARILAKETVETMFTLQFAPGQVLAAVEENDNHQQALAWSYHRVKAGKIVLGHGGGDPGVTTDAQFFPQDGVGAILLVNTSAETDEFRQAFENLMGVLLNTASE